MLFRLVVPPAISVWFLAGVALAADAGLYFPPPGEAWKKVTPEAAGWDASKLEAALEFARQRKSSGVVVLYKGRILAERYWKLDGTRETPQGKPNRYFYMRAGLDSRNRPLEDVASAQKSVTAILVGIAQEKGLLRIGDPVSRYLGEGWSRASPPAERRITVRHLLTMTSGLTPRLQFEAEPGTKWRYNTTAYSRSLQVVAAVAKKEPNAITKEWITGPLGMSKSEWRPRPWVSPGLDANRLGFITTPRDLARFGLMILAGGEWAGKTILADRQYLRAATSPSQKLNPSYGYLWWLNGQPFALRGGRKVPGHLIRSAPDDLFAAQGALGRKLYVVPSMDLVITRLGDDPNPRGQESFNVGFWRRLMEAAPSGR